eukprot:gnl/MRDRNA2_/MRDRNA2_77223_c0_seq2.p1 gnl/MRDRNA2_/MRDRNA2_77223_c0~~gnl/MRDRNA2_/MRDRNA2_77223_c0_seq2.p1  ORF type:complete len:472 (-),score=131.46 gnl/MRDRNA2_/MRDRNA2_77223_c0_seq2:147-1562(-)
MPVLPDWACDKHGLPRGTVMHGEKYFAMRMAPKNKTEEWWQKYDGPGLKIFDPDETDITGLHKSAAYNWKENAKLILSKMPDIVDLKTSKGQTAESIATKLGNTEVLRWIQKAHEFLNSGDPTKEIPYNIDEYMPEDGQDKSKTKVEEVFSAAASKPKPKEPLPIALMFPGQGSQYVKMLDGAKDLPAVKQMLSSAKDILGYDILTLCLEGPESKLEQTQYCQPAMFIGGLAGLEKLKKEKPEKVSRAKAMAGLSLGEYTALVASGVIEFEDGLKLVKLRGEAMQEAAAESAQAMLSVAGMERDKLEGCCADAAKQTGEVCQIANFLFPKGFSCAGTKQSIDLLKDLAEKNGALQARMLKTSGGFHTPLMQGARAKLEKAIAEIASKMQPPKYDLYLNATGEKMAAGSDPSVLPDIMARQLTSPVLWEPSVSLMIKEGLNEYYECGPMKQLKAMMKRIDAKMWEKTTNIEV